MPRKPQNIFINAKIVFRSGDKALYYYNPKSRQYDLPGGHLDWGESPLQALRREVREEFGYTIKGSPRLLDVTSYVPPEGHYHRIRIVYTLALPKPVALRWIEDRDPVQAIWISRKDIPSARIPAHLKTLMLNALK